MNAGPMLAPAHLARASAALGDGRHDDAFRHLWPVFDESDPVFHRFLRWRAVLDLAETGGRGDEAPLVAEAKRELEEIARRSSPPILCANLASARPLVAADDEAERLFRVALRVDRTGYPLLRARTLFPFGCWLHRQRRSAESRKPLHAAIDLFDALGATRWNLRARQELRATGETIGHRTPDAPDRLTAQQLPIASLRAQGLSNREIGDRLFLLAPHDRLPPLPDLSQARDHVARPAARRACGARRPDRSSSRVTHARGARSPLSAARRRDPRRRCRYAGSRPS